MIKAILFDVDGVLAIGEPFSVLLEQELGITKELTAPFFQGHFLESLIGNVDLKEVLADYLRLWGWQGTIEDFLSRWFIYEHVLNEPLIDAIQQWRRQGIGCYIATNQEKYRTQYILNEMGFAGKFDAMFSSAYIGYMKHDSLFFEHVVRVLNGIKAEEILFWDDSPGNIAVAKKAGLHGEIYKSFADFEEKMHSYLAMRDI